MTDLFEDKADTTLRRTALLVVKPDGLVGGKARLIIEFVRSHGFEIVAVELADLARHQWRELWRYQITAATLDRFAIYDLMLRGQALALLLRHGGQLDVPASVHLSSLKGSPNPASQSPRALRSLLGQSNRLFSFLHVADEPADVVRELAVMFDTPVRRRILSAFITGLAAEDRRILDATLAAFDRAPRVLDVETSLGRIEHALSGLSSTSAEHARTEVAKMRKGECTAWRPFRGRHRGNRARAGSLGSGASRGNVQSSRRARSLEVDLRRGSRFVAVNAT